MAGAEAGKPTIILLSWLALAVRLARADDKINSAELEALRRLYPSQELSAWIKDVLKDGLTAVHYAKRLAGLSERPRMLGENLFPGLFHVAVADSHLNEAEYTLMLEAAEPFELAPLKLHNMLRSFHVQKYQDAERVLGISADTGREALHQHYRGLCKQLHPDLLPHTTPVFLKELAELRFAAVNDAYHTLIRR